MHYTEVEMASHGLPKSHSKSTTEPQYDGCEGVTSSDVAMVQDPAYQSVDVAVVNFQLLPYLPLTCRNLIEQLCLQYASQWKQCPLPTCIPSGSVSPMFAACKGYKWLLP